MSNTQNEKAKPKQKLALVAETSGDKQTQEE